MEVIMKVRAAWIINKTFILNHIKIQWGQFLTPAVILVLTLAPVFAEQIIPETMSEIHAATIPEREMPELHASTATPTPPARDAGAAVYLFPMLTAAAGWVYWTVCLYSGVLLLGGRTSTCRAFQAVVWAWIPFAVRGGFQAIYILISGQPIANPGLSGLIETDILMPAGLLLGRHILSQIDIYTLAMLAFMVKGTETAGRIPLKKAVILVIVTALTILLISAVPELAGQITQNMITSNSFGG
jgi:hypothetical protein